MKKWLALAAVVLVLGLYMDWAGPRIAEEAPTRLRRHEIEEWMRELQRRNPALDVPRLLPEQGR